MMLVNRSNVTGLVDRMEKAGLVRRIDDPEEPEIKNDFYQILLIRGHIFSRVRLEGDTLSLAMLNPDSLKKMIK